VEPLRDYLEWNGSSIFTVFQPQIYETRLIGGQSMAARWTLKFLALLPKFPHVALDRGEHEARLRQIAGQVIWLVRSHLCGQLQDGGEKARSERVIAAWKNYVNVYYLISDWKDGKE